MNYYQHFRKDFIRPYGLAYSADAFDDTTLSRRLKTINCKFMLSPHVSISELSKTLTENWKYISDNIEIVDVEAIKTFLQKVESVFKSLQVLNQKETTRSSETDLNYCLLKLSLLQYLYIY